MLINTRNLQDFPFCFQKLEIMETESLFVCGVKRVFSLRSQQETPALDWHGLQQSRAIN